MRRRLIYQVAIGPERPLWERCLMSMETYCRRHGIEHYVQRQPILRIRPAQSHRSASALKLGYLPNLEKLHGLSLLGQFDDVALIDADVYAMSDAPDLFEAVNPATDYAAVVEREMPIIPAYARKLDHYARGQYGDPQFAFFNCGVEVFRASMVTRLCGQTVTEFLGRLEFADFINGKGAYRWASEQTLVNVWVRSCGAMVQRLDWRWNALYGAIPLERCVEARLVHFFLSAHVRGDDPATLLRCNGRPRV